MMDKVQKVSDSDWDNLSDISFCFLYDLQTYAMINKAIMGPSMQQ
jgi:hypothetical protein